MKKQNKKHKNAKSIDEKLKTKDVMFIVLFFVMFQLFPFQDFKGDTRKQALKLICLQFLQFLSNFNETLSISFSF